MMTMEENLVYALENVLRAKKHVEWAFEKYKLEVSVRPESICKGFTSASMEMDRAYSETTNLLKMLSDNK